MAGLGWLAATRNTAAGLAHALRHERPVRQEAAVLVLALVLTPLVAETARHGVLLIAVVLLVVAVELLNVGIEAVCDRVTIERNPHVKIAKDSGSAAVAVTILIAALMWGEAVWAALM